MRSHIRDTYKPADDSFKQKFVEDYNRYVTEWNMIERSGNWGLKVSGDIQVHPRQRMLIVDYRQHKVKLKFNTKFWVYHEGFSFEMNEIDITNIKSIDFKVVPS